MVPWQINFLFHRDEKRRVPRAGTIPNYTVRDSSVFFKAASHEAKVRKDRQLLASLSQVANLSSSLYTSMC